MTTIELYRKMAAKGATFDSEDVIFLVGEIDKARAEIEARTKDIQTLTRLHDRFTGLVGPLLMKVVGYRSENKTPETERLRRELQSLFAEIHAATPRPIQE